jgi:hypothetical protein
MLIKEANAITGGLSKPSKMPGFGYSIHPENCITGCRLREKENSVCSNCYGCKGRYRFPEVQAALRRRKASLGNPEWTDAMVRLISPRKCPFFRWHDVGDLQSARHLGMITEVAHATPKIRHWLPTKEIGILREHLKKGGWFPKNLAVRVSSYFKDCRFTRKQLTVNGEEFPTAVTFTHEFLEVNGLQPDEFMCPAPEQEGECGTCRACWDPEVACIVYREH